MHALDSILLVVLASALSDAVQAGALIDAAKKSDRTAIERLIGESEDVGAPLADGTTALHWASHRDDADIADMLLAAGAQPSPANAYGVTPLHLACTNRSGGMVDRLLRARAEASAQLWNGQSVLMECARTGTADGVAALLAAGADVHAYERKNRQTALMWAAAGGHEKITRLLLQHGARHDAVSAGGFTPLMYAARGGDIESARALLEAGANPDERSKRHGTALVVAAASGHEDLALFFLEHGADANVSDEHGLTPLHHAVANGLSALNGVRYDPVYRVAPANMRRLATALLAAGADPDAQIQRSQRLGPDGSPFDMEGATPFLLAAISADVGLMQLFRDNGASPGLAAKGGTTALMAAARAACTGACAFKGGNEANDADIERAYRAVRVVVEMGIDVNAKNEDGQTAIHMAAFTGADPVVEYLAENGADVNVTDNYGETPWSMASGISPVLRYRGLYGNHQSTAALLERLGATTTSRDVMDPNAPPPPGQ